TMARNKKPALIWAPVRGPLPAAGGTHKAARSAGAVGPPADRQPACIGAGCGLTEVRTTPVASRGLIALESSNTLVTTTDTIDTYSIGADGSLIQVGSVPDQLQVVRYQRNLAGIDVMSVSTPAGTVRNLYTGSMAAGSANPTL